MKTTQLLWLSAMAIATQLPLDTQAQIVLIGDNAPHGVVNDGDFSATRKGWREGVQSPFWQTIKADDSATTTDATMGVDYVRMFSAGSVGVAHSKLLDTNPRYQHPKEGDRLHWSFDADLEYISKGTLTFSLVFGEEERILTERVKLIGSDKKDEHFSGIYTLTAADATAGLPYIKVTFYSEGGIKVYLDNVRIAVEREALTPPTLTAQVAEGAIALSWSDPLATADDTFALYRQVDERRGYELIHTGGAKTYTDRAFTTGRPYTYLVTRKGSEGESGASNRVVIACKDSQAPAPPHALRTTIYDTEIALNWSAPADRDIAHYSIYRGDAQGNNMQPIATAVTATSFEDILAPKGVANSYKIYAHDYSGNRSEASPSIIARVNVVEGASFSDLILPMSIGRGLTSDTWGAKGVLPRDIENGIESPDWTYWGGRPIHDKSDGKYHMLVTRWPESSLKGHWDWPTSTVAHSVSDTPTGPYRIKEATAYDYSNGLGHNPDIIALNDGTYALYSLINWQPTIFTAPTMNGPWHREGVIEVNWQAFNPDDTRDYQYYRNLSGVQLEDGTVIMVSKFGAMMVSHNGLLGPYEVVTKTIHDNTTIPQRYRQSNYEDPVMWRDEVQFHLLINAFIDKRAIYLRSGDGIHWVFDPGLAYTPDFTNYENGVRNHWDKLERPHVLQDEYGRATHLSVAVIDVPKQLEYGSDNHNAKNLMIPLRVTRRLTMQHSTPIDASTRRITLTIHSEDGFDATKEVDLSTLRFGAASEVNYGRGCEAIKSVVVGKDLQVEFDAAGHGITPNDFAYKLLGRTKQGELIVGYAKAIASH